MPDPMWQHGVVRSSSIGLLGKKCRGQDLNLHAVRHLALNQACLPIPPPRQGVAPHDPDRHAGHRIVYAQ